MLILGVRMDDRNRNKRTLARSETPWESKPILNAAQKYRLEQQLRGLKPSPQNSSFMSQSSVLLIASSVILSLAVGVVVGINMHKK